LARRSLWELVQGGSLTIGDKYTVKIKAAHFGTKERRNPQPGQATTAVCIKFDAETEPDLPAWALELTVGNGWTIGAGGAKLEWISGQKSDPGISESSNYGAWIAGCIKAAPEWAQGLEAAGRYPDEAGIWVGTEWLCEVQDSGRVSNDEKKTPIGHLVPVRLLASGGAPGAAQAGLL